MLKLSIIKEELILNLIMICLLGPLASSEHKCHTLPKRHCEDSRQVIL